MRQAGRRKRGLHRAAQLLDGHDSRSTPSSSTAITAPSRPSDSEPIRSVIGRSWSTRQLPVRSASTTEAIVSQPSPASIDACVRSWVTIPA